MGIGKSPQNENEIPTPPVPPPTKAPYNIFTNCHGIEHKDCFHSREVSFNAHMRPKANIFNLPIMLNILQMVIFDWILRQYKRPMFMLETCEKLLSKKDDMVYLLLQFWDLIKADPKKAIKDKTIKDILDTRIANCHVLRKIWEENSYGAVQLEDPPESNKILTGPYNWLVTLTDLINRVLTKRRFEFFTASPPLMLVEADTILVSENTVQSANAWSDEKSVRLITIDGSRELQEIIFTGRFVREIIYIVQADDHISAGIESTLRFFAENSLKFKTTLVLHEPEKYTDRIRMVEQFKNMAETYGTGFYTMRGKPGELAEIRNKINSTPRFTTTESQEEMDADMPTTSGFDTTQIEKIREKFKPTPTMVAEPMIINAKLAAHYKERNRSPPASHYKEKEEERLKGLARTKWPQGKYCMFVIMLLAIFLPTVVSAINSPLLIQIQKKADQNAMPEFRGPHTTISKKGRRITVALSPEKKAHLAELQKRLRAAATTTTTTTYPPPTTTTTTTTLFKSTLPSKSLPTTFRPTQVLTSLPAPNPETPQNTVLIPPKSNSQPQHIPQSLYNSTTQIQTLAPRFQNTKTIAPTQPPSTNLKQRQPPKLANNAPSYQPSTQRASEATENDFSNWLKNLHHEYTRSVNLDNKTSHNKPALWCAHKSSSLWTFPEKATSPYCSTLSSQLKWKPTRVSLYSHVNQAREMIAHRCSIKTVHESYYTNLLGDRFVTVDRYMATVSRKDCLNMTERHICPPTEKPMGKLDTNSWSTNEVLSVDFPGRFASLFGGKKENSVTNCLVQLTSAFYKPQTLQLMSPVHNLDHCKFGDEFCVLSDNTSIIWDARCPKHLCQKCQHQFAEVIDGLFRIEQNRIIFVSKSREQALTFNFTAPTEKSCDGTPLTIAEQGFGIKTAEFNKMKSQRPRRNVDEQQFASEMTAAEMALNQMMEKIFADKCKQFERNSNPTIQARHLFNKENLVAKWLGENTMQVFSCTPIQMELVRPRPSVACFKYLPVDVHFYDRIMQAFLDPELRVLTATSPPADCNRNRIMYLEYSKGNWSRIDTSIAKVEWVNSSIIQQFHNNLTRFRDYDFHPLVFHEWMLHQEADQIPFLHIDELQQLEDWKSSQKTDEHYRAVVLGAIPGGLPGLAKRWLTEIWDAFVQHWIILSCLYSTFLFLRDFLIPITATYLIMPTLRSVGLLTRPSRNRPTKDSNLKQEGVEFGVELGELREVQTPERRLMRGNEERQSRVRFSRASSLVSLQTDSDSPFGNPLNRLRRGLSIRRHLPTTALILLLISIVFIDLASTFEITCFQNETEYTQRVSDSSLNCDQSCFEISIFTGTELIRKTWATQILNNKIADMSNSAGNQQRPRRLAQSGSMT
uniref:Uncharacterized protein n=1 Tax=Meloidogyne enterolobii TaxID=390850 RepID=A0A6V7Y6F3_MELEN|nr:unnamed protein product [Meloidogyne enterolobii]